MVSRAQCFKQAVNYVSKKAKIRNPYNQVPHGPQDTTWESDKAQEKVSFK